MWILGFLLWWTFDDHLAAALGTPGLGALPLWVALLAALTMHCVAGADMVEQVKKLQRKGRRD